MLLKFKWAVYHMLKRNWFKVERYFQVLEFKDFMSEFENEGLKPDNMQFSQYIQTISGEAESEWVDEMSKVDLGC